MDFTIVIPTYKEEKYLPRLLSSIKKQSIQPKEIIVSDRKSEDKTREIARSYGCKVTEGGSPAQGRNNGAKKATSPVLIFLDSDGRIGDKNFLKSALKRFEEKKLDITMGFARNEPGNKIFGKIAIWTSNLRKIIDLISYKLFKNVLGGSGWFLIVRKEVFDKIGGFDENLVNYEDTKFVKDVVKAGYKFGLTPNAEIYLSGRRYDKMSLPRLLKMSLHMFAFKTGIGDKKEQLREYESTKGPLGGG